MFRHQHKFLIITSTDCHAITLNFSRFHVYLPMLQVILRKIPLLYLPTALVVLATNWQNPRDFTSGRGIENCWVSSRGTDRLNKIRKLIQFCDVIMNKVLIDKTLPPVNTFEQSSQVYQKWSALLKKMFYPQWPNNKRKLWTIPPIHFLLEQLSKQKLSQHRRNSHSASIPLCELAAGDLCLLLIKFMVVI